MLLRSMAQQNFDIKTDDEFTHAIDKLKWVMACLRDPKRGCPWDKEQDFKSIVKYTIEEAYEVADAIEQDDMNELKEELGDLLLQVIYYTQMSSEVSGQFWPYERLKRRRSPTQSQQKIYKTF